MLSRLEGAVDQFKLADDRRKKQAAAAGLDRDLPEEILDLAAQSSDRCVY